MQLKLLWDLQEIDLAIRDLEQKKEEAPALSGVKEASEDYERLEKEISEKEILLKDNRKTLKNLEMREQKLVDDRKNLSDNMYDGTVTSIKELEQMQRKMELLAEDKQKTEDDILLYMESVEEQESLLEHEKTELEKCKQELQKKEKVLEEDLDRFKHDLENLKESRAGLIEKIEAKYINKYNMLAEKHQGEALAKVDNDICGGCRVFISSALRGHLYNPGAMVYCENCGRLLVRLES